MVDYEESLRSIDYARWHFNAIEALLRYKSDFMIDANKTRLVGDIDLVIDILTELKSDVSTEL
jgi:hypothetical protein